MHIWQGATSSIDTEVFLIGDPDQVTQEFGERFFLVGPFSDRAQTLPTKHEFLQRPDHPIWRALMPDPILWAPRNPVFYRIQREDETSGSLGKENGVLIALRDLYSRQGNLYLESRRWVMRAADEEAALPEPTLDQWREAGLTVISREIEGPGPYLATRHGVSLVVDLSQSTADPQTLTELIRPASGHAAVMAIVTRAGTDPVPIKRAIPHLLVGRYFEKDLPKNEKADFWIATADDVSQACQHAGTAAAVILKGPVGEETDGTPLGLRAACDRLQASVRGSGHLAGIWVTQDTDE